MDPTGFGNVFMVPASLEGLPTHPLNANNRPLVTGTCPGMGGFVARTLVGACGCLVLAGCCLQWLDTQDHKTPTLSPLAVLRTIYKSTGGTAIQNPLDSLLHAIQDAKAYLKYWGGRGDGVQLETSIREAVLYGSSWNGGGWVESPTHQPNHCVLSCHRTLCAPATPSP